MMLWLLLNAFLLSSLSFAQSREIDAILSRVNKAIKPQIDAGSNVGAVVGIYSKGQYRYLFLGETEKGNSTLPDSNTLFEIGSITKTFTGLLLAQEVTSGKLNGRESLDFFRPEWRGQAPGQITLKELVTHRSGLPLMPCDFYDVPGIYTEADLIRGLTDDLLAKYPDCKIEVKADGSIIYSNWGMSLLGYVLALNRNTTYPEMLQAKIAGPLGLPDTTIFLSELQKKRMARGHSESADTNLFWNRKILFGQGAIRSTARDLIKYGKAYLYPESTPFQKAIEEAIRPQYEGPHDALAYGWFITPGRNLVHTGMTTGYASTMKIYPEEELIVVYLTNTQRYLRCFIEAVENSPCALR